MEKGVSGMKTIRIDEDVYDELTELATSLRMTISGLASNILRASITEAKEEVKRAKKELNPLLGPAEATVEKSEKSDDWLWLIGIIGVALFLAARKRGGGEHGPRG